MESEHPDFLHAVDAADLFSDDERERIAEWRAQWDAMAAADQLFDINENWLRIRQARQRIGAEVPGRDAMWLWRLNAGADPEWWAAVGRVARELGYQPPE